MCVTSHGHHKSNVQTSTEIFLLLMHQAVNEMHIYVTTADKETLRKPTCPAV